MTRQPATAATEPNELVDLLGRATGRLNSTLQGFAPGDISEPCGLPDWSRGHLLTHIANNAEGLTRLTLGALSGNALPMYSSADARNDDIEAGATRRGSVIIAHAELATTTLDAAIAMVTNWEAPAVFNTVNGAVERPLEEVLRMRLREVTIHHVDLMADHDFANEDPSVLIELIRDAARRFSSTSDHSLDLLVDGAHIATIASGRPPAPMSMVDVSGAMMLGWLTGRYAPRLDLPALPTWG